MSLLDKDIQLPVCVPKNFELDTLDRIQAECRNLIFEFLADLRSEATAKTYWIELKLFFKWCNDHYGVPTVNKDGVDFSTVTRRMVVSFKKYLQITGGRKGRPAAPLTIIKKLSAIMSFYEFLIEKDYVSTNPASSVKRPRAEVVRDTEDMSDEETLELFRAIDNYGSKAQLLHKAIVMLLVGTGIRQGSLRNLKGRNLKYKQGIYVFDYFGKGGKKYKIPLHHRVAHHLFKYMDHMKSSGREIMPDHYIFQPTMNNSGKGKINKKLTAGGVNYIVTHYAKMIIKDKRITAHSCRATLIGSLLSNNEDIYQVSKDINHSSPNTTKRYDKRRRKLSDSTFLRAKFYEDEEE